MSAPPAMSRNGRHRVLRVLSAVARAWMTCASAGYWPPSFLMDADDPRVCDACGRPFACPLAWSDRGGHSRVVLRCGECGHRRTVDLPDADAARLKAGLAGDADAITREVRRLDAERMAAEVEALTCALQRDLIGAGDFAPHRR